MKNIITNAFSLGMVLGNETLRMVEIPVEQAVSIIIEAQVDGEDFVSAVGHEDTARVFSNLLGQRIEKNRVNVKLGEDFEQMLVGQLTGGRLPEGATVLPPDYSIKWFYLTRYI